MHAVSEPVMQNQHLVDSRHPNAPVYAEPRQHHQVLAQPSASSSVTDTTSGQPVTAYAIPGHHSTMSQSFASGHSEHTVQSYGSSDTTGFKQQQQAPLNSQPMMRAGTDRPNAPTEFVPFSSGSISAHGGLSIQTTDPLAVSWVIGLEIRVLVAPDTRSICVDVKTCCFHCSIRLTRVLSPSTIN